jgi:hypothetical protein
MWLLYAAAAATTAAVGGAAQSVEAAGCYPCVECCVDHHSSSRGSTMMLKSDDESRRTTNVATQRWTQDRFAISFFAQTHKPPIDDASFRLMRDGNFTTVGLFDHLGSNKPDVATVSLQQRLCQQYNLKCILPLPSSISNDTWPQLSPTQWGFYLADEPSAHQFQSLAKDVAAVRVSAPRSMSFINLLPSNVTRRREWGADNYSEYAQQLVDIVKPDVVCFDHYPNFGRVVNDARAEDTREDYVRNLELAGAVARGAKLPLWLYFNVVPYGGDKPSMPHEG